MIRRLLLAPFLMACVTAVLLLPSWGGHSIATAQTGKSKKSLKGSTKKPAPAANTSTLDVRAEQLHNSFLKDAETLAGEYFDAGAHDKARVLLQAALALDPKQQNLADKLKLIDETILTANDFNVDVDTSKGWEPAGVSVTENRPIRIQAEGVYKFQLTGSMGPAGAPEKDPKVDMAAGLPCGALIGIIVSTDGKLGRPFLIGEGGDITPKQTGLLLLKVNSPPENRHSGKLKVAISGNVQASS